MFFEHVLKTLIKEEAISIWVLLKHNPDWVEIVIIISNTTSLRLENYDTELWKLLWCDEIFLDESSHVSAFSVSSWAYPLRCQRVTKTISVYQKQSMSFLLLSLSDGIYWWRRLVSFSPYHPWSRRATRGETRRHESINANSILVGEST